MCRHGNASSAHPRKSELSLDGRRFVQAVYKLCGQHEASGLKQTNLLIIRGKPMAKINGIIPSPISGYERVRNLVFINSRIEFVLHIVFCGNRFQKAMAIAHLVIDGFSWMREAGIIRITGLFQHLGFDAQNQYCHRIKSPAMIGESSMFHDDRSNKISKDQATLENLRSFRCNRASHTVDTF